VGLAARLRRLETLWPKPPEQPEFLRRMEDEASHDTPALHGLRRVAFRKAHRRLGGSADDVPPEAIAAELGALRTLAEAVDERDVDGDVIVPGNVLNA
jgi:hypothetical protein